MAKPNKADLLIHKAFQRALDQNLLRIYLDTSKLNRPLSPVYNPWENLLPLLVPMLLGLFLIILVGPFFGLAFITGMLLIYTTYAKKFIDQRVLERTKSYMRQDFEHCSELWNFGGIVLATAQNKKTGCIAPDGEWKDFIIQNFADFMVDAPSQTKDENTDVAA